MALTKMDLWRLSDELSVVDASILITGNDPSEKREYYDENGSAVRDEFGNFKDYQRTDFEGFDPVFKAIRNAIFSNTLPAILGAKARSPYIAMSEYGNPEVRSIDGEYEFCYDTVVRASGYALSIFTNRRIDNLSLASKVYVLDEPDWSETMVRVDDLKDWLTSRGIHPEFFFPNGKAEGFRNKSHPRYSAKLACAVAAWEAVKKAQPNKSVKETVTAWVTSNAASFGLANSDGIVPKLSTEDIAKVVNWATGGGATPTNSIDEEETEKDPVNNFTIRSARNLDEDAPF